MAVSPLIALGVRPGDYDFSDTRLRNQQRRAMELEEQAILRKQQEEAQLIADLKKYGNDITPQTIAEVMRVNPKSAAAMQSIMMEREKQGLERQKTAMQLEQDRLKIADTKRLQALKDVESLSKIFSGVTDEQSYRRGVQFARTQGINPQLLAELEANPYDPQAIKQFSEQFMTNAERIKAEKDALEAKLARERAPLETQKLQQEVSEKTRGADGLTPGERASQGAPTAQQKEFGPFYEQWLKDTGKPRNAKSELEARREYFASSRAPVPGVDVPLSPEVEAQKTRMTRAGAEARAAATGGGPALAGDGLEMAARTYLQTGSLPARSAAMNAAIINRAAEIQRDANPMANKSFYNANSQALNALTKTANAVEAFEQTALANLDTFLQTAQAVIDTGAPILNKPLRSVSGIAGGSEAQAAFRTARTIALTEIAKVLTSPGSNAAITEGARKEVEGLIGPDATLGQIKRAAEILKRDMEARKQSTREQLFRLGEKIRKGESPGDMGGKKPTKKFNTATGRLEDVK